MNKSFVLKANKECIIKNWICFNIWYGQSIKESFQKTLDHFISMEFVCNDIKQDDIKVFLIEYVNSLKNENVLNKFIDRLMEQNIVNSFNYLMKSEELNFNNKNDFHNWIIDNVIPGCC